MINNKLQKHCKSNIYKFISLKTKINKKKFLKKMLLNFFFRKKYVPLQRFFYYLFY